MSGERTRLREPHRGRGPQARAAVLAAWALLSPLSAGGQEPAAARDVVEANAAVQPDIEAPAPRLRDDSDRPLGGSAPPGGRLPAAGPSGGPRYGLGLLALPVVLGLIAVLAWLLKRMGSGGPRSAGSAIRVLHRAHLAPKQSLALVGVGRRVLLIGLTPERISHLATLEEPLEVAALCGGRSGEPEFGPLFDEQASRMQAGVLAEELDAGGHAAAYSGARQALQALTERVRSLGGVSG